MDAAYPLLSVITETGGLPSGSFGPTIGHHVVAVIMPRAAVVLL